MSSSSVSSVVVKINTHLRESPKGKILIESSGGKKPALTQSMVEISYRKHGHTQKKKSMLLVRILPKIPPFYVTLFVPKYLMFLGFLGQIIAI